MEKFFRQFGDMPNGTMKRHHFITGEGSGFLISADGYAELDWRDAAVGVIVPAWWGRE